MNRLFCLLAITLIFSISCNESSTTSPEKNMLSAYSIAIDGCKSSALSKDPVKSYEFFDDSLKIRILVEANCCPGDNRFITSTSIKNDSVHLRVHDTAMGICDCNCLYEIQTVISKKGLDSIYFTCEYQNSLIVDKLISRD